MRWHRCISRSCPISAVKSNLLKFSSHLGNLGFFLHLFLPRIYVQQNLNPFRVYNRFFCLFLGYTADIFPEVDLISSFYHQLQSLLELFGVWKCSVFLVTVKGDGMVFFFGRRRGQWRKAMIFFDDGQTVAEYACRSFSSLTFLSSAILDHSSLCAW